MVGPTASLLTRSSRRWLDGVAVVWCRRERDVPGARKWFFGILRGRVSRRTRPVTRGLDPQENAWFPDDSQCYYMARPSGSRHGQRNRPASRGSQRQSSEQWAGRSQRRFDRSGAANSEVEVQGRQSERSLGVDDTGKTDGLRKHSGQMGRVTTMAHWSGRPGARSTNCQVHRPS